MVRRCQRQEELGTTLQRPERQKETRRRMAAVSAQERPRGGVVGNGAPRSAAPEGAVCNQRGVVVREGPTQCIRKPGSGKAVEGAQRGVKKPRSAQRERRAGVAAGSGGANRQGGHARAVRVPRSV